MISRIELYDPNKAKFAQDILSRVERLVIAGLEIKAAKDGLTPAELKAYEERIKWAENCRRRLDDTVYKTR